MQQSPTAAGMVTIPYGETSATFTVAVLTDCETEIAETFTLILSSPSANAGLGATTAATFTIYAQFAPEDVLDTLNPLSEWVDILFEAPTTEIPYPLAYYEISLDSTLSEMDQKLDDIEEELLAAFIEERNPDHAYIAATMRAYDNLRSLMTLALWDMYELVDTIISLGTQAAEASQGSKFRIEGIGADMNQLNLRLEAIHSRLSEQKDRLTDYAGLGLMRQPEAARHSGAAFALQTQMTQIENRQSRASAIYTNNIDNEAANETIEARNAEYAALADLYVYVLGKHQDADDVAGELVALHSDIENEVGNAQIVYEGRLLEFGYRIYEIFWAVTEEAEEEEPPFSVVDISSAAKELLLNDAFALKGLADILNRFDSLLDIESQFVSAEIAALEDIALQVSIGSAIFDNLEELEDRLGEARTAVGMV